ncbi:hypothetical protein [Ferroacidibacillus organovorans]|uniref:Uncharacterized protein n=1 Tax=Ferroacidibacillus organovorans TaxID=1765683 RepID=A0A162TU46_9BACL|nr:hypothetical protein [Ferroacidibacillus organovorans]KYP81134.1 hypothetical protein AYJ22_08620 [Ferroacidibacillus organovorans]OAG93100.1 hypothetical protein AYW79_12370 [Ferroacidibacillus organovorans]OPG16339.1 hypothetical protein B2M26_05495 [Ferroacidibacillus organovorans]
MERNAKPWMFVSIAILIAELGRIAGSSLHLRTTEHVFDGVAIALCLVAFVRFLFHKYKKNH